MSEMDENGINGENGRNNENSEKYDDICNALELDRDIAERAWSLFASLNDTYTLAGRPIHWIGLSIYTVCMLNKQKFKCKQVDASLEGNQISFSKVLKLCDLNARDFFGKFQNWTEMTGIPEDFKKSVDKLEINFRVAVVLFDKLHEIFYDIFLPADSTESFKSDLCTSSSLFEFCWYLFICVKGKFKDSSDNLVTMYHVLLGCIDIVFTNAYLAKRKDIINPEFEALQSNWASPESTTLDPPCIISYLCKKCEASTVDAKRIKHYNLETILENFFSKKFLKGNKTKFLNLLDLNNFNYNLQSLSHVYGTYMLNTGEFDERILLVGRGTRSELSKTELSNAISLYESDTSVLSTPLTGRQYLNIINDNLSPVSKAIQPLIKLQEYLLGCSNSPSSSLISLLQKCQIDPINIVSHQKKMALQFLRAYSKIFSENITGYRLNLIEVLYFKLFEQILLDEQTKHPKMDLKNSYHEMFHKTLFACCTEIIIFFLQPSNPQFLWVLDCFGLDAFYFHKIIELVVLTIREKLNRNVIKHLSIIEESCLDSLCWKSDSSLWKKIYELNEAIPQYCDVKLIECTSCEDTTIKPGQSLLKKNLYNSKDDASNNVNNTANVPRKKQVKAGSLGLFFRKFYNLAYTRLQNLCDNLRLKDERLIIKIWTCLEHGIIQQTHLMRDRHLDQILMCTVYATCKISNIATYSDDKKLFNKIIQCYKLQPQPHCDIYENVLLSENLPEGNNKNISPSTLKTSNHMIRGNLKMFYDNVFIPSMGDLIRTFGRINTDQSETNLPKLSPLPEIRRNNRASPSAYKILNDHRFYISSLTPSAAGEVTNEARFSCIYSSPKDLQHINRLVCSDDNMMKKRPFLFRENNNIKKVSRKCMF